MTDIPLEHVHVAPDDEADGEPAPAVFVLHGRGADEEDLLPVAAELPGDRHVVSLRAPDPLQGGYTWYELDLSAGGLESSQPDAEDFRRSLDLIVESVEGAVDAYGLDADRIGLLGFSQGAITSLSLLLEAPDRYAWVVALHGYLAESHADLDPAGIEGKPVFVGAGAGDRVIPESRTQAAVDRLDAVGADVAHGSFPGGHGIGPQELEAVVEFVGSQTA
ncbi:phospholipase [Halorubrum sp. Atlit-8R]|uniref:alpha/beta hydrolase n=1 Tax=unclassified Halorubrum TaxID=2642239 RepID=UPI000EF20FEA|nr:MULTISPECIES: alpha/beta hydrolase-fold protein [unclassified Halorubrum]RLM70958.1 phospholipase [Halorubrum sp. Atlit-9R]RLM71826.1 phospholipase [Halorubrum sp. Atlit-9R]RLM82889.1 phospholipase [Halorubrum sp. Atlit-8R]